MNLKKLFRKKPKRVVEYRILTHQRNYRKTIKEATLGRNK